MNNFKRIDIEIQHTTVLRNNIPNTPTIPSKEIQQVPSRAKHV